jgi:hypothetical protein
MEKFFALRREPIQEAAIPFPREDITPPVTNIKADIKQISQKFIKIV